MIDGSLLSHKKRPPTLHSGSNPLTHTHRFLRDILSQLYMTLNVIVVVVVGHSISETR